nr:MAG TPA: hypothetical protein [Caudoviricetes sp.]
MQCCTRAFLCCGSNKTIFTPYFWLFCHWSGNF